MSVSDDRVCSSFCAAIITDDGWSILEVLYGGPYMHAESLAEESCSYATLIHPKCARSGPGIFIFGSFDALIFFIAGPRCTQQQQACTA